MYHVQEDGWVKVSQTDTKTLHYEYQDEKKKELGETEDEDL